jgi:hypothetical protein
MILDVLLPSFLFLIAVAVVFLYARFEKKVDSLFEGRKLRIEHAVLLVAAIGIMVTVLIFVPERAMMFFFLFVYSVILFLFTYLLVPKWYLAVPVPFLFIALYLSPYWNIYLFNFFAIIFAVCISIYIGSLFTWKTTAVFVALVTIMDVIQVRTRTACGRYSANISICGRDDSRVRRCLSFRAFGHSNRAKTRKKIWANIHSVDDHGLLVTLYNSAEHGRRKFSSYGFGYQRMVNLLGSEISVQIADA